MTSSPSVPATSVRFNPGSPDGGNGWYRHPVHVTVSASDIASTISATRCVLDPGSAPGGFGALPSACPFTGSGGTVGGDGGHTLYAAEIDYLVAQEWAIEADDVLWRRTKCGLHLRAEERDAVAAYLRELRTRGGASA